MKWRNNSALFNYTHTRSVAFNPREQRQSNITDGIFIVDFPLATRHIGQVTYTYEVSINRYIILCYYVKLS